MKKFTKRRTREEQGGIALTVIVVALVLALNLILAYVGGTWGMFFQIRDKQYYTLNGSTDAYFDVINPINAETGKREKSVRFYFCMSEKDLNENYTYGRIYDTVRQFAERYDFITFEHKNVYYDYAELAPFAERTVETQDKNGQTVVTTETVELTDSSVIVYCPENGQSMVRSLSSFYIYDTEDSTNDDMVFNGEEAMATLVSRVVLTERPKAYFTTGHGESSSVALQQLLYSAGYDVLTADISRNKIEDDCALIIISAPYYDFKEYEDKTVESEISRLREFVSRGGVVWVLRSPMAEALPRLDAFCADYGLCAEGDAYLRDGDRSLGSNSAALLLQYAESQAAADVRARAEQANRDDVVFGLCAPITVRAGEGYTAEPLLYTYNSAVLYRKDGSTEEAPKGGYTVAATSTVAGGGRVVLAGTAAIADSALVDMGSYGNEGFLYALTEQAGGVTAPVGCGVVVLNTHPLADLNRSTANTYFVLLTAGVPLVCGVVGFFMLRKRRVR